MELKTLKDFDFTDLASGDYHAAHVADDEEIKKVLRKGAIKWIKALRERSPKTPSVIPFLNTFFISSSSATCAA